MSPIQFTALPVRARIVAAALCLCMGLSGTFAYAHAGHAHHGASSSETSSTKTNTKPPAFVASTAKSFDALMNDAMAVMDYGMLQAPMNGNAEHDFVTMMIPHHQGAVDMAKAVLLYSRDTGLRNLALGIIAEQQNEINVMQTFLQKHAENTSE
ncbi:DUF305 family protein family protein [Advenella incenata]|jgi:uncharacterized protein (DUF305 family)|uniref:DUF305 family protein family protein n=1 Tax=Advenella incenata TaxID=267800 RepID=A0A4Q7VQ09_9BURK|nr:DUF305 domain-containing protein [Advenella incenata]RZT98520.1 DUF305 family protein family protein [Advenella incenata]